MWNKYLAKVSAARLKHPTGALPNLGKPPPDPGPQPFTTQTCQPPTAFGIVPSSVTLATSGSS